VLRRVSREQPRDVVVRLAAALDGGDDATCHLLVGLEDVAAHPGEHQSAEASRIGDRNSQQGLRAEREADRVTRSVGERLDHPGGEIGVLVRVVRFGCRAMAEQVDSDNVASGVGRPIGDILGALVARARVKVTVETDPALLRPNDTAALVGDCTRLRRDTGWSPRIPFEQMLDDLLEYWRTQ